MEKKIQSVRLDHVQDPDPKSKDTSLPGREEEVIVNEQEQNRVINTDDVEKDAESEGERAYKEGLQNNSDTEEKKIN